MKWCMFPVEAHSSGHYPCVMSQRVLIPTRFELQHMDLVLLHLHASVFFVCVLFNTWWTNRPRLESYFYFEGVTKHRFWQDAVNRVLNMLPSHHGKRKRQCDLCCCINHTNWSEQKSSLFFFSCLVFYLLSFYWAKTLPVTKRAETLAHVVCLVFCSSSDTQLSNTSILHKLMQLMQTPVAAH